MSSLASLQASLLASLSKRLTTAKLIAHDSLIGAGAAGIAIVFVGGRRTGLSNALNLVVEVAAHRSILASTYF